MHDFKIPYMQEPLQINLPSSSLKCFFQKPLQINVPPSYLFFCAKATSGAKCAKSTPLLKERLLHALEVDDA